MDKNSTVVYEQKMLATTQIDISGKLCNVVIFRNENGNIEILPVDEGIFESGGWLENGTITYKYKDEIKILRISSIDDEL